MQHCDLHCDLHCNLHCDLHCDLHALMLRKYKSVVYLKRYTFLYKILAMDENHFAHLEGIVHPDKYEILTSMTHDDKLHIMGELVTKMDIDGDEDIGTSELSTWIHYVEQAR